MKKLILCAAVAVFALTSVNAQEENATTDGTGGFAKGDVAITGGFGFGTESTGDMKVNTFTFMPTAGFFVTNNIAVGVNAAISTGKEEDNDFEATLNTLKVGAFGQYYFTPSNQFSFLVTVGAGFTSWKYEEEVPNFSSETKSDGFYAGVTPGINYFVSDHFAIQAHVGVLGYETTKPDADGADSTDSFDFGVNFKDISFCLVYKF
jgi:outer membrane protein